MKKRRSLMKYWFTSLNAAITFSVITLITQVWRGFLDAMFVLPVDFDQQSLMQLAAAIYTLLFTAWAWTIFKAWQGSRKGVMAAFLINGLLLLAIPIGWLLFYCPAACRAQAGLIFNLANTSNLVFGLLAGITLAMQIWQRREAPPAEIHTQKEYSA
jgi:hypothetical protein